MKEGTVKQRKTANDETVRLLNDAIIALSDLASHLALQNDDRRYKVNQALAKLWEIQ